MTAGSSAKGGVVALAFASVALSAAFAFAQSTSIPAPSPPLLAGAVEVAREMVASSNGGPGAPSGLLAEFTVEVEGSTLVVESTALPAGASLVLYAPVAAPVPGTPTIGPGVEVRCATACPELVADPTWAGLGARLSASRDEASPRIWALTTEGFSGGSAALSVRGASVYVLLALVLFALFEALLRVPRVGTPRQVGIACALVAAFAALALLVPEAVPLHDHNLFVARFDCAYSACGEDPRRAWAAPSLYAVGLLLNALPYGPTTRMAFGLALTLGSMLLLASFLTRLFDLFGERHRGARIAICALAVLVACPALWRLSVAATLWPYAIACLITAGWLGVDALRRGSLLSMLGAAGALALTVLSVRALLPLGVLAVLAPLAWRKRSGGAPGRGRGAARWLGACVLAGAASAPYLGDAVGPLVTQLLGDGSLGSTVRFTQPPLRTLASMLPFDTRLTAVPIGVLTVLGGVRALAAHRRALLPVLVTFVVMEYVLAAQLDLFAGYPNRFINASLSFFTMAVLAGVGAEWLVGMAARRARRGGLVAGVLLIGIAIASTPLANESMAFLHTPRHLGREVVRIESLAATLPPHDRIVLPPEVMPLVGAARPRGDNVEVFFPLVDHLLATESVEQRRPPIPVRLGDFLYAAPDGAALFYLGSALVSWLPEEIEAGAVDAWGIERPILHALRERYELRPIAVFEQPTADHPATRQRLAADRAASVELGYYELIPR